MNPSRLRQLTPNRLLLAVALALSGPAAHAAKDCSVTVSGAMKRLIDSDITLQSDTTNRTISSGGLYRPLFVKSGTVTIRNLTLANGKTLGGNGGWKAGGGGAGLGGALFVYSGALSVENVTFTGKLRHGAQPPSRRDRRCLGHRRGIRQSGHLYDSNLRRMQSRRDQRQHRHRGGGRHLHHRRQPGRECRLRRSAPSDPELRG